MEFKIGTELSHTKYGTGKIIDTDKNTVLINFSDSNENLRFLKDYATKHKLFEILTKAPGLYDENDNLVAEWTELIETKRINVEENTLIKCNTSLKGKLVIDDNITSIGYEAFAYCDSLTSITMPDSIISISRSAFNCCKSLKSLCLL